MQIQEDSSGTRDVVGAVKQLMLRNGVAERQQSKKLAEILELSYSQAHRKLSGGQDFTWSQLQAVAEFFGDKLGGVRIDGIDKNDNIAQPGVLSLGGAHARYPCLVWVGEQLSLHAKVDYVALREGDVWRVIEASHFPDKTPRFKVEKLELIVKKPRQPVLAIVDDERGFTDNLSDFLRDSGFEIYAFYNSPSIERAMEDRYFDGYVIDWVLGSRTAESLIKKIRDSGQQDVPIYMLTGEVITGRVEETEVARVIKQYGVQWKEKPIRLAAFSAELQKAFGAE